MPAEFEHLSVLLLGHSKALDRIESKIDEIIEILKKLDTKPEPKPEEK